MVDSRARSDFDVIVIGAGIGGLSVAALLARRGFKVLVAEAHNLCGGNCTSWRRRLPGHRQPFTFDSGVQDISGLGANGPLTNLFRQLGISIPWERVHHLYWHDGIRVRGGLTQSEFVDSLCHAFPGEADGIRHFMAEMAAVYRDLYAECEKTGGVPLPPPPHERRAWCERHPAAAQWLRQRFTDMLQTYLSDARLQLLLQTLSEYIAATPDDLTVHDMAPLYGYYFEGGHYPCGGSQSLADALAGAVRDHKGKIVRRTRIEKILTENGRVAGVRTARGERYTAPIVVANGDVVSMLTELVDPPQLATAYAKRVAALRRGPSAILVSLGLSTVMDLPPRIFIRQGDLAFGVGNPSVLDARLAPPGHSAVTLLLLLSEAESATWGERTDPSYLSRKTAAADRLIAAVEQSVFPALRSHIVYQEVATPATFKHYTGARNGNIYGAARAIWRPAMNSPVSGLFLVGAGTDTGAGIEAVVISATRAADTITATLQR